MIVSSNNLNAGRKAGAKNFKAKQSRRSIRKICSNPTDVDVLCGRGRGFFDHPGNRRMLSIISKYKPGYQAAPKIEKSTITQQVLKIILEPEEGHRPRFLKRRGNGKDASWYELCEKEVHKKVAHTLREHKIIKVTRSAIDDEMHFFPREKLSMRRRTLQGEAKMMEQTKLIQPSTDTGSASSDISQSKCPHYPKKQRKIYEKNFGCRFTEKSQHHLKLPTVHSISDGESLSDVTNEPKSNEQIIDVSGTEPLSILQEPFFSEGDLDALLHNVLHEEIIQDTTFGSFLQGGVDICDVIRSSGYGNCYGSGRSSKMYDTEKH